MTASNERLSSVIADDDDDENVDILEKYLRAADVTNIHNERTNRSQPELHILLNEINELETEKRLPINGSVLQYWEENKEKYPCLFKVAQVINGIPPTQVPVERSFSVLGFIFNCKRVQLKQQTLEDIIHIKLNKDLTYRIFEQELKNI